MEIANFIFIKHFVLLNDLNIFWVFIFKFLVKLLTYQTFWQQKTLASFITVFAFLSNISQMVENWAKSIQGYPSAWEFYVFYVTVYEIEYFFQVNKLKILFRKIKKHKLNADEMVKELKKKNKKQKKIENTFFNFEKSLSIQKVSIRKTNCNIGFYRQFITEIVEIRS